MSWHALHADPTTSRLLVWGLASAPGALWLLVATLVALRARARSRADFGRGELRPGREQVLRGEVCGPEPVVAERVIEQRRRRGSWRTVRDETLARPFPLRTPGGEVVEVCPGEACLLAIDPTVAGPVGQGRECRARVAPGDVVYVRGRLELPADGRYRLSGTGGRPVAIRSRSPAVAYEEVARTQRGWALGALALLALIHTLLFGGYHARAVEGRQVEGVITARRQERGRRGASTFRYLTVRLDDGRVLEDLDTAPARFPELGQGDRVPLVVVPGLPFLAQLGPEVTVHWIPVVFAVLFSLALLAAWIEALKTGWPWLPGVVPR